MCSGWSLGKRPGGRLNIKMPSYQYRDSHYKDKTVSRPSYLYNRNILTWKDGLHIEAGPKSRIINCGMMIDKCTECHIKLAHRFVEKSICVFYPFTTLRWNRKLKTFLVEFKDPCLCLRPMPWTLITWRQKRTITLIARFMGPTWGPQDPGGPHVGPMNFAIWAVAIILT